MTRNIHSAALMYAKELENGQLHRREFLARATALGLSIPAAYGFLGETPAAAEEPAISAGGVLRIQMEVKPLKEPRLTDWSSIANTMRGTFEHLVEYNNDGSFRGMLLQSWEANEDATMFTLHLRPRVLWHNGEAMTAAHVAWNIEGWCDSSVEGNSMASRMAALVDPETGKARSGAIEVVDDLTLKLRLSRPDISVIPAMADFPAAIVHPSFDTSDIPANPGTGPYLIESIEVGVKAVLVRNTAQEWWGTQVYGGPHLDRIEYLDFGTDPASWVAAYESEEVDMLAESVGAFIDVLDGIGAEKSEVVTAATAVIRTNQKAEVNGKPVYADRRVRRALALAVDNAVCLELGIDGRGITAENHHIAPMHPEYAKLPALKADPEAAFALMQEAGMADFEHELISIDDEWLRNTTDAVAAQLRDAGFKVKRTILPGATFWNDWAKYPFSSTNWNHRALGVQILSVAYRSDAPWNETGFESAEFDALLNEALAIAGADKRGEVMRKIETLMQEEGVIIQPYWRSLYRHVRPGVLGGQIHITLDHHHYKMGFENRS